ncbi:MAG: hypothetical protein LC623_02240 [Halobacteriales archaeon]|nr:hypothetical protein [Halobacteriales archaeon]
MKTRKGSHHDAKMRGWRLNGGLWPDDREPRTAPLPRAKKPKKIEDIAFHRMVEWITTDLEGFLPNEISDLGVVSMDAWDDVAPESCSAALVDLDGKQWDTFDRDAYYEAQQSRLKAAVIQALQKKGVRVVPTRQDALRLLASTGKLNEDHLTAFENEIQQDVSADDAAGAVLEGQEAYSILSDGRVVTGLKPGARYFTVKEASHAV